ncbi:MULTISPECIES: amino acid permease [Halobacteriales]|uniref:Amino acid permease n=3 Tax=Halobacteriales TaxID=2235 RepID=A0A8U0I343_9EURY|nr:MULTISPECIES: amino acid permease [Halobacteriales]UPV77054.1 amino acid permease [Halorussus limi]USZ78453.1 amino acid permease [Halorussus vallis]
MTDDSGGELERNIGFLEAMTLGGGTMIGAGIFILPGIAAEGAGPASSISFILAGFVALLAALSLSELATGMPIAGGSYHYVNRALGGLFGSIVGWGMWSGLMFASAFYMIGFGQYLVEPIPFLDGRLFIVLLGLAGLALIVGVNYYGTEESSQLQNVMIGTETVVVLAYVALGLFFIDPSNLEPFAPTGPSGIIATTGVVFVSFLGFEIIATVAGEVKDPSRNIPLTMILSVVLVTILYALVMLVSTGVIRYEALGDSLVPVSDVAVVFMGSIGVVAIVAAAAIAAISSSNSSILAAARVNFAMGRDELMSNWLNVTHDRFGTPHRAIIATGAVTALLIAAGLNIETIVALLAEVASFSFLVSYSMVHVALVVFRRADPEDYDPSFKIPDVLYPAVPILGVVLSLVVISQMASVIILLGLGIVGVGVGWYFIYVKEHAIDRGLIDDAISPTVDGYTVVVPVVNPETQQDLLRLAAATAHAHTDEETPELVAVNVLQVADPSPQQNIEAERLDHQHDLLEAARDIAAEMDVNLRTVAMTGQRVDETILEAILEEDADQVLLGWKGTLTRLGHVFGPNLDSVVERAPCEVTLVTLHDETIGTTVALAGPGPHSPVAARRAAEFATVDGSVPTLVNVQPEREPESAAVERGEAVIEDVAHQAGLDPEEYESEVIVADDIEATILETVNHYNTICVGLSERSEASRIMFGTIAERISQEATSNVGIVRGPLEVDEPATRPLEEQLSK